MEQETNNQGDQYLVAEFFEKLVTIHAKFIQTYSKRMAEKIKKKITQQDYTHAKKAIEKKDMDNQVIDKIITENNFKSPKDFEIPIKKNLEHKKEKLNMQVDSADDILEKVKITDEWLFVLWKVEFSSRKEIGGLVDFIESFIEDINGLRGKLLHTTITDIQNNNKLYEN